MKLLGEMVWKIWLELQIYTALREEMCSSHMTTVWILA
jgi:hypothetical protein